MSSAASCAVRADSRHRSHERRGFPVSFGSLNLGSLCVDAGSDYEGRGGVRFSSEFHVLSGVRAERHVAYLDLKSLGFRRFMGGDLRLGPGFRQV